MKENMSEAPRKVAVSKGRKGWYLTLNVNIVQTEEGYDCDSVIVELDHRPTIDDVRQLFHAYVDGKTDEKILTGFIYADNDGIERHVWLSRENQSNFSEAQRLADKKGAENYVPETFKISEDEEKNAKYRTFNTLDELNTFYEAAFAFIKQCLRDGWVEKDSFDASEYEELLENNE